MQSFPSRIYWSRIAASWTTSSTPHSSQPIHTVASILCVGYMAWYMFQDELPPRAVSRCKFDDLLDAALEPADSRSGLHTARRLHGVLHVPGRVASKSCTASSPSYLPSGLSRSLSFWYCCWCTRGSRSLMVWRRRDGLVVQFLSSSSSSVWSGGWVSSIICSVGLVLSI
jgi:hypothetical protein